MEEKSFFKSKGFAIAVKILQTLAALAVSYFAGIYILIFSMLCGFDTVLCYVAVLILPALLLPLVWVKKRKKVFKGWGILVSAFFIACGLNIVYQVYDDAVTVNQTPNIMVHEYMPFESSSKIVELPQKASLALSSDLPIVDSASAVFPVCSAFVNATYLENTQYYYNGVLNCNGTSIGYNHLAREMTDIFFGSYPSEEQIAYAEEGGTEFVYTPIGKEAFVFFVHKDNPVDNLTTEQIQGIYSGEITNWSEVGGENKKIAAYQRDEGSGSQTRLIRFMGEKELMEPPTELRNEFMSGIIEKVSDYRSNPGSIGFSFRYYVEEIIQNPDIKLLSVDGVAPTVENIKDESYPLTGILYAVTYKGNDNPNVEKLIDWILSKEGQYIIEETGYVSIK